MSLFVSVCVTPMIFWYGFLAEITSTVDVWASFLTIDTVLLLTLGICDGIMDEAFSFRVVLFFYKKKMKSYYYKKYR